MVVEYPLLSEKAVNLIERENKIVFVVRKDATKSEIKDAMEKLYNVRVTGVNTSINRRGQKIAFIKLAEENKASDLAVKLNIL